MSRVENVLELKNITKRFGETVANEGISLKVKRGEIHALLGENGAGKSTLMNIVFGLLQPDEGEIAVYERPIAIENPNHAIDLGIGMVHQHFKLVDSFTVTENIILGLEPKDGHKIDMKKAEQEVREISEKYGFNIDPKAPISELSVGMQQKVEILKSLYRGANLLIFDEPSAVLTPDEINELLIIMKNLIEEDNKSIILITHKLDEIMKVADKCTVIRKGKYIDEVYVPDSSEAELAELMVGRVVSQEIEKQPYRPQENVLEIKDLNLFNHNGKKVLEKIDLAVRAGEIVGIAGVDGNGQEELIESIVNMRKIDSGEIILNGQSITNKTTREIYEAGVSYVPADRHKHGLVIDQNIAENLMLLEYYKDKYNNGMQLNQEFIYEDAQEKMESFDIRAQSEHTTVAHMSGGNQQKIILAREISRDPELLIVVQPTRGLDIGAIHFIYDHLVQLRDRGVAILLVSFELSEILTLSDRIKILFDGKIIGETTPDETNDTELGLMMAGKGVTNG